ncbi:MAG: hypothetical protein NTW55_04515, partial [Planctomycetota bacterium]|nr:hypothetical protein [Planctomycetota bacterium]
MALKKPALRSIVLMFFATLLLIFAACLFGHFRLMTEFFVYLAVGTGLMLVTFLRIFHLTTQSKLDEIIV